MLSQQIIFCVSVHKCKCKCSKLELNISISPSPFSAGAPFPRLCTVTSAGRTHTLQWLHHQAHPHLSHTLFSAHLPLTGPITFGPSDAGQTTQYIWSRTIIKQDLQHYIVYCFFQDDEFDAYLAPFRDRDSLHFHSSSKEPSHPKPKCNGSGCLHVDIGTPCTRCTRY